MAKALIDNLGQIGYVADRRPATLPPNAWSFMQNVRCEDKSLHSFAGHETLDTIVPTPQAMRQVKSAGLTYLVYADNDSLYSWRGGTETVLASGIATGPRWDSCTLGGVAVFTNGTANPYYWGGAGAAQKLPFDSQDPANICYWEDVTFSCRVIRSFKYHLFALNVTDCNGKNGRVLRWSHPAEPGSLPLTWDITDADYDAGRAELSDTPGEILDAAILRDTLQVYKEDAIYQITYTGDRRSVAQQIFNIRLVTDTKGIYAKNCVADVGGRHFVVGDKDIYLYDGSSFATIADERIKNLFFNGVNRIYRENVFVTFYERLGEVWLCYPDATSQYCNKVLVWNIQDNTWSEKTFPTGVTVSSSSYSTVDRSSGYTWATLPAGIGTWSNWTTFWGGTWDYWVQPVVGFPLFESLILGGPQVLLEMDRTNQGAGTALECIARRTDLDLGDKQDFHMVRKIRPIASGDAFQVRVGSQLAAGGAVTWQDYQTFNPSSDIELNFRSTGRLHAIEFYSNADVDWEISGYEVDYVFCGSRGS